MRIVTRLTDLRQRLAASQSTQAQLAEALVAEVACTGLGLGDFPKHFTPPRRLTRPEPPHVKRDPPSLTLEPVAPPASPWLQGGHTVTQRIALPGRSPTSYTTWARPTMSESIWPRFLMSLLA